MKIIERIKSNWKSIALSAIGVILFCVGTATTVYFLAKGKDIQVVEPNEIPGQRQPEKNKQDSDLVSVGEFGVYISNGEENTIFIDQHDYVQFIDKDKKEMTLNFVNLRKINPKNNNRTIIKLDTYILNNDFKDIETLTINLPASLIDGVDVIIKDNCFNNFPKLKYFYLNWDNINQWNQNIYHLKTIEPKAIPQTLIRFFTSCSCDQTILNNNTLPDTTRLFIEPIKADNSFWNTWTFNDLTNPFHYQIYYFNERDNNYHQWFPTSIKFENAEYNQQAYNESKELNEQWSAKWTTLFNENADNMKYEKFYQDWKRKCLDLMLPLPLTPY